MMRALALAVLVALAACHRPCGARCVPAADDGACGTCLKARCCAEAVAWYDGTDPRGFAVVACVDKHCARECPREGERDARSP
jgi:hypothetical protein